MFSRLVIGLLPVMVGMTSLEAENGQRGRLVIPEGESHKGDRFFAGDGARIAGELIGDLFFAGRSLRIDGNVTGDLIAGGQDLGILGEVQGDVWAAGQDIRVEGNVREDLRSAGRSLEVRGKVAGNVLWFGQELRLLPEGEIGKNLRIGAERAVLSGKLGGDLDGDLGELTLGGEILGDVDVRVGRLTIDETAVIHGSLRYESPLEATVAGQAQLLGGMKRAELKKPGTPPEKPKFFTFGRIAGWALFLGFLLTGTLWIGLFPGQLEQMSNTIGIRPLATLGLGFVLLVAIPVAGFILLITLIGLPLGVLTLLFYAVSLYLCSIPVAAYIGRRALSVAHLARGSTLWWGFLVGTLLLGLLFLIPWLGFFLKLLVVIVGLGTIVLTVATRWQATRAAPRQLDLGESSVTVDQ